MGLRKEDRIFVAGHRGLVGRAIVEELRVRGYTRILTRTRQELNLLNQADVDRFYAQEKPDVIFLAAAKVGGIHANNVYRADFIGENLQIQNNVILSALKHNVRRVVFLGSSCIYPKHCEQPIREEYLLTGPLEDSNRPYAIAKIAGLELVNSIRQQHGKDWFSVMPTNLYGPGDNFDPETSHVLPALIRRFEEARIQCSQEVVVWGTGSPKREFMLSSDCAKAIVGLAERPDLQERLEARFHGSLSHFNVGIGEDVTIAELARTIAQAVGFNGAIRFDSSKLDGTPRKVLDTTLLQATYPFRPRSFVEGLRETLAYFRSEVLMTPQSAYRENSDVQM